MELKPYQQMVVNSLAEFISYVEKLQNLSSAYKEYWNSKGVFLKDASHPNGLPHYKSIVAGVPHVALKVPTAGGKTFIAANSLRVIFDSFSPTKEKAVVWLVPSTVILQQTIRDLRNPDHPYRQKIDAHFNSRVEVYEKDDLLQGASFNPSSVKEQLSIFVLSFDSFRTKSKDGRKVYQENENLSGFFDGTEKGLLLEDTDEGSLMNVIRKLAPVVIVDESHNAESDLSVEMLNNLNPSFVLDLTATPRENSNIISFVDSMALKKENMVKLPVIVYNHHDVNEVIVSSVELRSKLELSAGLLEKAGGEYIRPIVLFQAQPRSRADSETFVKIKEKLIEKGIPEQEIAIKTATVNEIKGVDLMGRDCEIRYIITVNALKEGWDCPFAYVLASLANRSSKVDVEQVLGRILRQPYVKKHDDSLLNMSYVLTASSNFHDTLESIVLGLNKSGFSSKDFRVHQEQVEDQPSMPTQMELGSEETDDVIDAIDDEKVPTNNDSVSGDVLKMIDEARLEEDKFEEKVAAAEDDITWGYTDELVRGMNIYQIKDHYKPMYKEISLPQFFIELPEINMNAFEDGDKEVRLSSEMLLDDDFELKKQNTEIDFDTIFLEVYKVDVEETGKEKDFAPKYSKLNLVQSKAFIEHINSLPEEGQLRALTSLVVGDMGRMDQFADSDLRLFVQRVIEDMDAPMRAELKANPYTYARKIKLHIESIAQSRKEEVFSKWIDSNKMIMVKNYNLPNHISPSNSIDSLTKSLYIAESDVNGLEKDFIVQVASLNNVKFWHKIIERKGFYINGFLNHYPDFLIVTNSGNKIIVETKGGHLDNTDSQRKLKLGKIWANKAGDEYRYFMVFDSKPIEGAYTIEDCLDVIKNL